jgi:hypothetical protein
MDHGRALSGWLTTLPAHGEDQGTFPSLIGPACSTPTLNIGRCRGTHYHLEPIAPLKRRKQGHPGRVLAGKLIVLASRVRA